VSDLVAARRARLAALRERGVLASQHVGIRAPNGAGFVVGVHALMRLGARRRATAVLGAGVDELTPAMTLQGDTLAGEMVGLMHLTCAHIAAREQRPDEAHDHVDEAERLAQQFGHPCAD